MKAYRGVVSMLHSFLTSPVGGANGHLCNATEGRKVGTWM